MAATISYTRSLLFKVSF